MSLKSSEKNDKKMELFLSSGQHIAHIYWNITLQAKNAYKYYILIQNLLIFKEVKMFPAIIWHCVYTPNCQTRLHKFGLPKS